MKILKSKTFQSYFFLLIFLMLIEVSFSLLNKTSIFNISFLKIFLLINIISIVFGYMTSFLKGKITYIADLIIILAFSIYAWVQLGFYHFIGVFASLNASGQLDAVTEFVKDFLRSISASFYLIYIPFLLSVIAYIVTRFLIKKDHSRFVLRKRYFYQRTVLTIIAAISIIVSAGLFNYLLDDKFASDDYQAVSSKELFLSHTNPSLYVKEYGVISFLFTDLNAKANGVKTSENLVYFAYNNETDGSREFDDTNWETLIEEEEDETYNSLNNYFINNTITNKNDYTGMFKDKNLIVIMLESANDIIYNEEYFPNFYKLASEGWYFSNNYSPRNSCATGNNEFSAMSSLYSIYDNCTTNEYADNKYPNAIFNLFNQQKYYTNSFHNYTDQYYYRTVFHPNMGSQKYYGVEDLDIEYSNIYGEWPSDIDLMEKYLDIIGSFKKNEHFMSYITTVTGHQPYVYSCKFCDMHLDMTKDTDLSLEMRRYMSKLKVTDDALGVLIDGLEERNILDDTVIVIFGDHYPYGMADETIAEALDRNLDDYDIEKTPLVIYNPEMEPTEYKMYTSYINLTPTLANLFDLDFDPRLYAGVDVFSEDYMGIVSFPDSSWKNEKAFYNANNGTIKYYGDEKYTDKEIKDINTYFYSKMNASSLAIKNNYFDYLDRNLKLIEERKNEET